MHQRGCWDGEDLPDPEEFDAGRGAVLAFDFRDVRGMDGGLVRDLLLRQMGTKTSFLNNRGKIAWTCWVLSHRQACSSPRGRAFAAI